MRILICMCAVLLCAGCTITTKEQGKMGIRVLAGEWGVELYHETPDTDEASTNLDFDKTVMDWLFVDHESEQSVEPEASADAPPD